MKVEGDDIVFECSGRREYANNGILGIADAGTDEPYVSEGYDGGFGKASDFTSEERHELADYTIALWQRFRAYGDRRE